MRERMEKVNLRVPKHLDDQILDFMREHNIPDYNKAARYLLQTGLMVSNRLDKETIKEFLLEM